MADDDLPTADDVRGILPKTIDEASDFPPGWWEGEAAGFQRGIEAAAKLVEEGVLQMSREGADFVKSHHPFQDPSMKLIADTIRALKEG